MAFKNSTDAIEKPREYIGYKRYIDLIRVMPLEGLYGRYRGMFGMRGMNTLSRRREFLEMQNKCAEIKIRLERKAGQPNYIRT